MTVRILVGDCRKRMSELPDSSVQTCVTSPPYFGLRDYGHAGQMGLEPTPDEFVAGMVDVFREVRRVMKNDGTLWLNLGDSYSGSGKGAWGSREDAEANRHRVKETYIPTRAESPLAGVVPIGLKPKDLIGIPWRVAFALQSDGWYLRSDIIWHKPNPMPESVTDRPTKSHEYLFLLSKSERYYYDAEAIAEPSGVPNAARSSFHFDPETSDQKKAVMVRDQGLGTQGGSTHSDVDKNTRNKRTVWTVPTMPFKGAHFATFPPALIEPCILAGSRRGGAVLDPFGGAGTTGLVADRLGRDAFLCELNPAYAELARERIQQDGGFTTTVEVAA